METTSVQCDSRFSINILWFKYSTNDSSYAETIGRFPDERATLHIENWTLILSRISNQEVYDKINIIINKGTDIDITWQEFIAAEHYDNPNDIVEFSEYVMRQQNKLLGHVIRSDTLDPMKLPTIDENLNTPGVVIGRTGKPRLHWVKENCK